MSQSNPQVFTEVPLELPASHAGHGYTRLSVASLRRQAQKLPTLSGVADHLEALGGEVQGWETRARALHALGLSLQDRCQHLERQAQDNARFSEGMIEDFCSQRQNFESEIASLSQRVIGLSSQVNVLSEELARASHDLSLSVSARSLLEDEQKKFLVFHENVVKDLDRGEAAALAKLTSTQEELEYLRSEVSDQVQVHEEDVAVASSIIADLMDRLDVALRALEASQQEAQARESRVNDIEAELRDRTANHMVALSLQSQEMENVILSRDHVQALLNVAQETVGQLGVELAKVRQELLDSSEKLGKETEDIQLARARIQELEQSLDYERIQLVTAREMVVQQDEALRQAESAHALALSRVQGEVGSVRHALEEALNEARGLRAANVAAEVRVSGLTIQLDQEAELRLVAEERASHLPEVEEKLSAVQHEAKELSSQNTALIEQCQDLRESLAVVQQDLSSVKEGAAQQVARLEGDLSASQDLLEEEMARARVEHEKNAAKLADLSACVSRLPGVEAELLEERAAHQVSLSEVARLTSALDDTNTHVEALRQAASRAAELDVQVSALHELLRAQSAELQRVEAERRAQSLASSGYDDSMPWPLRSWSNETNPNFIPVPGVREWMAQNGWSVNDLGAARFPGYSAADREHLVMSAGVPVAQFLALPFVRECMKQQVKDRLAEGTPPPHVEGEWVLVDGSPRWRTNRLWKHLLAVSEASAPQAWNSYLNGELLGV